MGNVFSATASSRGFTVKAYSGDRCAMLAFDLADHLTDRLAGFAIRRKPADGGAWTWLGNRLSFEGDYTSGGGKFFPSNTAPFQKFRWLDFPAGDVQGAFCYEVVVKRFVQGKSTQLEDDQTVQVTLDVGPFVAGAIEVAFTRGYLSSQAYADEFGNKPFEPSLPAGQWRFDWAPYETQWAWLGAHARTAIEGFLTECYEDPRASVDAFVYDLNEPAIVTAFIKLASMGKLRMLADDAKLHETGTAAAQAFADIQSAATEASRSGFKRGKFKRYQHNKVLIKRVDGVAQKVLTGSTNYSITGLYVNANHVFIFDDAALAAEYAQAFDTALKDGLQAADFYEQPISMREFPIEQPGMPPIVVSFAPHRDAQVGLGRLLKAIDGADSSVIFAVMDLNGTGQVLKALAQLHTNQKVFSYGISDSVSPADDTIDGTTVYTATSKGGELVYSKANPERFPPPFSMEREVTGPAAHIVHHKFVVVDFNGTNPVVFGGSSNLAEGGETSNGDNLVAIYDRSIATAFAIEGIRLVDHYAFAAALKRAGTSQQPLRLKLDDEKWWARYYTAGDIREKERKLFSR
ncbi:phospholipase D-like domain-containing protein [Trinickia diaoshuihuensis]|uniref:phospholipase D-like domain-containing protein n=1 Tax=Trinickia diaoshuihuensis TaxID=2292265 RepID=UPI000E26A5EE|nr:phospholipase D-like domain-containing protein [Trinickia diaoshuihuensis]